MFKKNHLNKIVKSWIYFYVLVFITYYIFNFLNSNQFYDAIKT